ncbi:MAG: lectin-like protein, partial [Actinomycetota bacterium]|nr:lectin-like protein [Actinomycetota bacterium]
MRRGLILTLTAVLMMAMVMAVIPASAVNGDRTVVAWGLNQEGQTDVPSGLIDVVAVEGGGQFSLALNADGTVEAWGSNFNGQTDVPSGLTDVVAISAGSGHSLALKGDGTVVAWGYDLDGQATVPTGLTDVEAIAAGGWHSLALKDDGTVVAWGLNFSGQATVPPELIDVEAIAAGGWHSLALMEDGTVVAWGGDNPGETDVPANLGGVKAIAAGYGHSLALKDDGTVVAWGYNRSGQIDVPGGLTDVVAIAAGGEHNLALKGDGTLVTWGSNAHGQDDVPLGLTDVGAISAGSWHSLVTAVYDQSAGFVTGGGWIDSPAGAYYPDLPFFDGSYYELVPVDGMYWGEADAAASAMSMGACQCAHLATITSAEEQAVLTGLMAPLTENAWIGGYQEPDELGTNANWKWVTGEDWGYKSWAGGEPNDNPWGTQTNGSEQHLEAYQGSGLWNDAPGDPLGILGGETKGFLVVEYENCDPTGTATFGFVSKYKKGATVPTGNTSFHFPTANLIFHATTYDSMVVTVNDTVMVKG